MPSIKHRDFSKGLFIAGGKEAVPPGFLRQSRGTRPQLTRHVRSRWGSTNLTPTQAPVGGVRDIVRFNDRRYCRVNNLFLQILNGELSPVGALQLGGGHLRYAFGIPTDETDATKYPNGPAHMFVAGARLDANGVVTTQQRPFKVSTKFADVSRWGMPAPTPINFRAYRGDAELFSVQFDPFDRLQFIVGGINLGWTLPTNSGAYAIVTNNKQEGSGCLQLQCPVGGATSISKLNGTNLGNFGGVESSEQDWIEFWLFIDDPVSVDFVEILFDVTPGNIGGNQIGLSTGIQDAYSFRITGTDPSSEDVGTGLTGLADAPEFADLRQPSDLTEEQKHPIKAAKKAKERRSKLGGDVSQATARLIVNALGSQQFANTAVTWTKIRIPKQNFRRSGRAGDTRHWNNVRRCRITLKATEEQGQTGAAIVYLDDMRLHIGAGMQGIYKYAYTWLNENTGTRSNPSEVVVALDVFGKPAVFRRDFGEVSGIQPPPADLRATHVELWRTVGNGEVLFFARKIALPVQTATDITADFGGLQDSVKTAVTDTATGLNLPTQYLLAQELPFDNGEIPDTIFDVAGPYQGRLFLLDGAKDQRGRVTYTGISRLESVQGFVDVTGTDEKLLRILYWSAGLYAIGEEFFYELSGTNEPFIATRILGVPGTRDPESAVTSPEGIIYRAHDGIRVFNGAASTLLYPEPILPLFRGEASPDVGSASVESAFGTTKCAAYHEEEYRISDGTLFLAINVRTGAWRNIGFSDVLGAYSELDTGLCLVGTSNKFLKWEDVGVLTDDGVAIPFAIETPGTQLEDQSDVEQIVQRLYIDGNTRGQQLTPIIYWSSGGQLNLPAFVASARERQEYSICQPGEVIGVQLHGSITNQVDIFGVDFDFHLPEQAGEKS